MRAEGQTQAAGVTWTGEKAFATLDGKTYAVPSLLVGQLAAGVEQAFGKGGPMIGIDLKRWVPNPVNAGTAQVGGVETVKLTGEADVKRVLADVEPADRAAAAAAGARDEPERTGEARAGAGRRGQVADRTVYTGAEDQILRRLVVDGDAKSSGAGLLDLTLTKVGEDQQIAAPNDARPFNELLETFRTG